MARIIFTSRYLKNQSATIKNFVEYIATRPNAEIYSVNQKSRPSTEKQKIWIDVEIERQSELKELFEYEDYIENPTVENASLLISRIAEYKLETSGEVENYIGYLANRPRSEKLEQGHALWSGDNENIDLNKVKKEVSEHKGYIWTHVVSLRRDDAETLGYNNAHSWRELVRSKIPLIAKNMKIPVENLKWYAAFHNEGYHPHIHLMVYSSKPREGYLTEKCIDNMRRGFATEIFHDELYHAYEQKDEVRNEIKDYFSSELKKAVVLEHDSNPKAEALLLQLSESLKESKYKAYGRLHKKIRYWLMRLCWNSAKIRR